MKKQEKVNPAYNMKKQLPETAFKTGNAIVTAYFLALTVIYPFFVKDGYWEIGEVKYYFFRNVSLAITAVMIIVAIIHFILQIQDRSITALYESLSVTDWFVYGYFMSVLISYVFTPFKRDAFWGADGWYMGFVSQLLFVSIYFLFSRYFIWNIGALYTILLSSAFVFLLGILNRYSIYPIDMGGQTPGFISTLGNINWFCGYWAVICPFGIVYYWNSRTGWQQALGGIYVMVSFLIGVVQGSSSAYLVFAGIFIFLFVLSFRNNQAMQRFIHICILFALACQIARLFRYLPGFEINYENELAAVLTDSDITLYIGIIIGVIALCFHYLTKYKDYQIEQHKNIRKTVLIFFIVILAGYILLLALNSCLPEGILGLSGVEFLTFNDAWANYRGATWITGALAYHSMPPLRKLIGMGPDCFAEYIYSVPDLAEYVYGRFGSSKLTNAHNEWLTLLVNQGIIGIVCYAGIFISAVVRFLRKVSGHGYGHTQGETRNSVNCQSALYMCAACVLAYTVHNMVSFQQVLNAPFVFMALGIGEGVCRKV